MYHYCCNRVKIKLPENFWKKIKPYFFPIWTISKIMLPFIPAKAFLTMLFCTYCPPLAPLPVARCCARPGVVCSPFRVAHVSPAQPDTLRTLRQGSSVLSGRNLSTSLLPHLQVISTSQPSSSLTSLHPQALHLPAWPRCRVSTSATSPLLPPSVTCGARCRPTGARSVGHVQTNTGCT